MSDHAKLSASGAERWMNCTPSAALETTLPDTAGKYAAEGTLAHKIAELKVRAYFIEPMNSRTFKSRLKKLQADPLYDPEMLTHTDAYLEYIKEIAMQFEIQPLVVVEKRLDFSEFVPGGFGTGDCLLIGGDSLHVVDFKYGRHVLVAAEENPQMCLYALGAITAYAPFYPIDQVTMHIFQPRADGAKSWESTKERLLHWGETTVRPLAQKADAGEGELTPGDWCRFCRAAATCRARSDTLSAVEAFGKKLPPLLADDEVGDALTRGADFIAWYRDLEKYALAAVLDGKEIAGWKAVEGRSNRQFIDQDRAFAHLIESGYDEALLYKRTPITLTETEKLLGKTGFAQIAPEHVHKPQGKPTLVKIDDPRDPFKPRPTAQEAFNQ